MEVLDPVKEGYTNEISHGERCISSLIEKKESNVPFNRGCQQSVSS